MTCSAIVVNHLLFVSTCKIIVPIKPDIRPLSEYFGNI